LRKYLDQAHLFGRRQADRDRAVGDGLRPNATRRLDPRLCRHSKRNERDQGYEQRAGIESTDHDQFLVGATAGDGWTMMEMLVLWPAPTPRGAWIVTGPP